MFPREQIRLEADIQMKDIYTESVVPVGGKTINRVIAWILIVMMVMAGLLTLIIGPLYLLLGGVFAALYYFLIRRPSGEYDYVHTNEIFDVDLVTKSSKRKSQVSVNLGQVVMLAPLEHPELERFQSIRSVDYTGNAGVGRDYAMVYSHDGQRKMILLQLDEKMLNSLKLWLPGKVVE